MIVILGLIIVMAAAVGVAGVLSNSAHALTCGFVVSATT
jgi:hypothetical protein